MNVFKFKLVSGIKNFECLIQYLPASFSCSFAKSRPDPDSLSAGPGLGARRDRCRCLEASGRSTTT